MAAAHCGINEIQAEHGEGKGVVAAALLGGGGDGVLHVWGLVDLVQEGGEGFLDEELNLPVRRVEDAVAVVFTVLIAEFQAGAFANKMGTEQTFVNVAQLADFERAVVNGFVGGELALARSGARWGLRED
jgi:hypothetical protein